jgi:hypothetical protein
VTLENARGLTQSGWNSVSNHADGHAGHTNLLAAPGPFTGDLPAPVRLDLALNEYWPTGLGTLLAAQSVFSPSAGLAGGPVHQVVLEGESGPAYEADGALVDDAGCSGGQYHRLTWTGSYASRVWVRDLPERLVHGLGGRPARLVARLAEPWPAEAGEQTWVTWQLSYVTTTGEMATFYETAGTYLEPGAGWLLGPLLHVPPWHLRAEDTFSAPLRLSLTAQAAGAGLHSLPLDYVSLVPLDGWRIYRPLIGVPGLAFVDDGPAGVLRGSDGAQSHLPEGPGLFVYPGRPACFAFFVQKADGGNLTADIDTTCLVKMYYHPRKALI